MTSLTVDPQKHRPIFRGITALLVAAFGYFVLQALPYYPTAWGWIAVIAIGILWFLRPGAGLWFSLAAFALPIAYHSAPLLAVYVPAVLLLVPAGWIDPYGFLVLAAAVLSGAVPRLSWLLPLAPLAAGFKGSRRGPMLGAVVCLFAELLALLGGRSTTGILTVGSGLEPLVSLRSTPVSSLMDFSWVRSSPGLFAGTGAFLSRLFTPFAVQPVLISQVLLWALASGVIGALLARPWRRRTARLVAVAGGILILGAGSIALSRWMVGGKVDAGMLVISLLGPAALGILLSPVLESAPAALAPSSSPFASPSEFAVRKEVPTDTWEDMAGIDDIKEEIQDAIRSQFDPKIRDSLRQMGIRPTRGILLFGPPGTGKTQIARIIAHEAKAAFFAVSGTEFTTKWYGESEANLRGIFEEARRNRPAVLFFDELEAFLPRRTELSRSDAPEKGIVATFLAYTDGIEEMDGVLLVGATNYPHLIDPAALRPGRFDKLIYVSPPDRPARRAIFERYLKGKPLASDVDLDRLAARTERFTGADIRAVCEEAARQALSRSSRTGRLITMADLETAIAGAKPSVTLDMLREYEAIADQYGRRAEKPKETEVVERPVLRWDDVAGLEEVKEALKEAIEIPLKHPQLLREYGVRPIKGVLLFGPPGCGKTFLAKVVASEADAKFLHIKGPELLRGQIGQSEAQLRAIFTRARENTPCVLFFDEIDAFGGARGTADASGTQILTQFLTEMDGVEELKGVIVVGATNRPDVLDPALLRPGRFDRILYVPPPDFPARMALIRHQLASKPVAGDVDYEQLARMTEGYSAADISAICDAAARRALRETMQTGQRQAVTMQMLVEEIARTPRSITDEQMATYEALRRQWQR